MELQDLRLLGGRVCLNFANSYDHTRAGNRVDFLESYADLVRWSRHAGLLTDDDVARLTAMAADREREAQAVVEQATGLRDALRGIFVAVAKSSEAALADLTVLHRAAERAVAGTPLAQAGDRFVWDWRASAPQLDQMLWPVTHSAIDLLTTGDLERVKLCADHDCGWLFYDASKNRSRRWCSMEGCGASAKMRRQYAKRRAAASDSI